MISRKFSKLLNFFLLPAILFSLFTFHLNDNLYIDEVSTRNELVSIETDFFLFSTEIRIQSQEIWDGFFDLKTDFFIQNFFTSFISLIILKKILAEKFLLDKFLNLPPPLN